MADEIVNRVAKSSLKTIDLEDYYPEGKREVLDIKQWLFNDFILKEVEFREHLKNHNWQQYQNQYVALSCSRDVILPSWAFLLVTTYLNPFVKKVVIGNLTTLETAIFYDVISSINYDEFKNLPIIIKGCSNKPIPETAYAFLIERLQPVAQSIMFGEACSTVPLFKKK